MIMMIQTTPEPPPKPPHLDTAHYLLQGIFIKACRIHVSAIHLSSSIYGCAKESVTVPTAYCNMRRICFGASAALLSDCIVLVNRLVTLRTVSIVVFMESILRSIRMLPDDIVSMTIINCTGNSGLLITFLSSPDIGSGPTGSAVFMDSGSDETAGAGSVCGLKPRSRHFRRRIVLPPSRWFSIGNI